MPNTRRSPQRAVALRPQPQLQTPKREYHAEKGERGTQASPKSQPLSVSDDDLQQEIARARKRAVPSTLDVTPPPAKRPSSAVNTKASANPPQQHPRGGEHVARQALLVPPKPNGVLLGRTPSHSGVTSRSNSSAAPLGTPTAKVSANEGGATCNGPKQRMGSPVSAPMRINEQRKGVEDGSKRVVQSMVPRGAEARGDVGGKGVPIQASLPPRGSHPPSRVLQKDRPRLPPPQLGDEVPTPPRDLHVRRLDQSDEKCSTQTPPGTRQQHQWMEVLNYVDAITIAVTHRARAAPPVSQEVGEAWGGTIAPGASPRDALVGGGVPLSLGGLGPSARSPRSVGLMSIHDLQRSVGGLLHWFGLLELRSMPDGTSVRDADRNLQMLGQDVLRHLGQVNQSLLEAAARRGTQSLNFVKAQSHPSFEDCVHSINRMLSDGKGLAAIRDVVARRDVEKARAIVNEHRASLSSLMPKRSLSSKTDLSRQASPRAVKASPTSKFQQKRSVPLSSSPQQGTRGQNSTVGHASKGHEASADRNMNKLTLDPSRPTYPPTLVDWLERQWLPAAEEWGEILKTAQITFTSPIATRESITKYMDSVQADINARQAAFQEMLLPGENLPRLVQSLIVSPGTEAARIAGKREEKFGRLKAAISKCDFVDLSAKLKEVRDAFPDESMLSELEVSTVREGQRLLLNMQHVAKVTMGLTQALGASSPTGSASTSDPGLFVRAADVRPLLKAITAANQTLLDLKLAIEKQKCDFAVDRGCALLVQVDNLEQGSSTAHFDTPSPSKWLAFYRLISAAELVVAHVPGGAWPPELTLLYQRAAAALGTAVEREIARHDVKRQLQKHLVPLSSHSETNQQRGGKGQGLASDLKSPVSNNAKVKANNPIRSSTPAGEVNGRAQAALSREERRRVSHGHRGGSTSTEMIADFSSGSTRASASPAPVDEADSHRRPVTVNSHESGRGDSAVGSYSGTGTVAIEDLRVLISRGRQLGLGEGPEIQQLQRVLESATELRLKIHFDSNIRVLGLPLERVSDATTSSGIDNIATAKYASPSSQPAPRQSRPRYEPPSFERAFDRIYRFCTNIPTPSQALPTPSGLGVGQRASYGSATSTSPLLKSPSTNLSFGGLFTPLDTNFRIRYQDSDGDYITVASEEDWRVLLSDHYRGVLAGGGGEGGGKTSGGLGRKIEIFCDIPPLPQHALPSNSNQSQQVAGANSQATGNDKGNYATPYRASPFIPSTMPLTAKVQTPTSDRGIVGSRGRGAKGTDAVHVESDEMGIRGRNMATGAANQSPSTDAPFPSLSPPASATKRSGFTVQHASGAAATARHGQGSAQATRASIARPKSQPHPPPSRSPAPTQKANEALNELMRRDRDPQHNHEQHPSQPRAKAGAAPEITINATIIADGKNVTKRNSKSYSPTYGTGGGIGVGLGSASLRPSKTTDDDGTLSVIEVYSTNAGWGIQKGVGERDGGGSAQHGGDDDGFDIRTLHSVATAAFTAEDRDALVAHLALPKKGGGGGEVPKKEKGRPLEVVQAGGVGSGKSHTNNNKGLLLKPTASAVPNDKKPPPVDPQRPPSFEVVGASEERGPLTWQEAHGDDYDVNTIMSEETTVAIVRQREAVTNAQTRQRSEAKSPAMGKSPVATGASKKPLTTAELNQRRALLLAQLRKQRQTTSEGSGVGGGVQESRSDLSVGAQKK